MRKLLAIILLALLCVMVCACQEDTPTNVDGGVASTPTASQPATEQIPVTVRRPAHELQDFGEIVGWYVFEYSTSMKYPDRVVRQDLQGNELERYELLFGEDGIPYQMHLIPRNGQVSPHRVELFTDERGNIYDVRIYDEENQQTTQYRLTYDENDRMVTTERIKQGATIEMDYDEYYHLTHVEWRSGIKRVKVDLAYDRDHKQTKRLIWDEAGVLSGWENIYSEDGKLVQYCAYQDGEVSKQKYYNEKELLTQEVYYSTNGQTHRIVMEYDQQDRVAKTSLLMDEVLVSWTEIAYHGNVYTRTEYNEQGVLTGRDYTQTDDQGNVLEKISYGGHDNVLQHENYVYTAQGNLKEEKKYTYEEDGSLKEGIEKVYNDQGEAISEFRYTPTFAPQGFEKIFDENGNMIQHRIYSASGNYTVRDYLPGTNHCIRYSRYDAEGNQTYLGEFTFQNDLPQHSIEREDTGVERENFYTEVGKKSKYIYRNADGQEQEREEWTYHANGNMATNHKYRMGQLVTYQQYDENGRTILRIRYDDDGNVQSTQTWEYVFGQDGTMQKSICTTMGEETQVTETEYYENGRKKSEMTYAADGKLISARFYDEQGQPIPQPIPYMSYL